MRMYLLFCCLMYAMAGNTQLQTATGIRIDSLPESQIDIPIQVNLRPIFALAEKKRRHGIYFTRLS